MFTVYIPSLKRFDIKNGTAKLMQDNNINYKLVVEPHEFISYCNNFGENNVISIDRSGLGEAYVRNWIKKYSKSIKEQWHWQLDDDISSFCYRRFQQKRQAISAKNALLDVEIETIKYNNVSESGINFDSWRPGNISIIINRPVYRCVLIKNDNNIEWREFVPFCDWDYSMQLLNNGFSILKFDHIRLKSPKPGTFAGGLDYLYAKNNIRNNIQSQLIKEWPECYLSESKSGKWINARKFFKLHNNPLNK
jgi:hypothetical protein